MSNLYKTELPLPDFIVERMNVGIFAVDAQMNIILWNRFMAINSGLPSEQALGNNLFDRFPDLPRKWLERKIQGVFLLKNFSFTSWEQRPYLFKFPHNRPVTGGVDCMRQDCTFLPMKDQSGEVQAVCIIILDVTDTSVYQGMLKEALASLEIASNRDGLTGVYNRRFLEDSISKEFSRIKRYGGSLSLILLDLDHFKTINDTYGHLAGDEVLREASKRFSSGLRQPDILGRYGGEEFCVILPETGISGALVLAQRMCNSLSQAPIQFDGQALRVTASGGIAHWRPSMEKFEVLIKETDEALYYAKETGRNRVCSYENIRHLL